MAIIRWDPFNANNALRQVDDDLSDFLNFNFPMMSNAGATDVWEDDNDVYVKLQIPGFTEDDIKITVDGQNLTVRANKSENLEDENNDKKYYRKEIRQESFVRSITLPNNVSSDKAQANYTNGILTLTLPKTEEAKPKEIKISGMTSGKKK